MVRESSWCASARPLSLTLFKGLSASFGRIEVSGLVRMRQAVIFGAGILVSAGLLSYEPLSSAPISGPSQAVISTTDGYGVSECLTSGDACGLLVAQSWCRSNGYDRLAAIRPASADDVTSALGTLVTDENGGSVVISCARKDTRGAPQN